MKRDAFTDIYVRQEVKITIKNAIDVAQKRTIQKNLLNKYPVFELWKIELEKIRWNNICLRLDNNIFKPKYKIHKTIRNILNYFYKDKKMYLKNH